MQPGGEWLEVTEADQKTFHRKVRYGRKEKPKPKTLKKETYRGFTRMNAD